MRIALLTSAAALAVVLAGTSAAATPPDIAPPQAREPTGYGDFLAGRAAYNAGESRLAADYLTRALRSAPDAAIVGERALSAALIAGDVATVAALAPRGPDAPPALQGIGRLADAVQALNGGDARAVHNDWTVRPITGLHARAGAFLAPWVAAAAGDWRAALAEPAASAEPLTRLFTEYHRALLLEHRRRYGDAEAIYQSLIGEPAASALFRQPYGEFLERRGRRAEAIAVYDAGLTQGDNAGLRGARERAAARGRPPAPPSLRRGAAHALNSVAAAAMAEGLGHFGIVYLRFSLALEPEEGATLLMLGEALDEAGLNPAAREVWASVPLRSPVASVARVQLAWSLQDQGLEEQALAAARAAVEADPRSADAAFALGSLLSAQNRHDEALAVLGRPSLAESGDWRVHFIRGAAYEQAGAPREAQAELQAALALRPDSPEILNYLGYLWIDAGERVEEGVAMVERAVAQEPESGAYLDSLAWGRYRQGRYEEAVTLLEQAIGLEPADPVINDHLGDAYWRVGRRREADFQWRRVLTLDPDPPLRAEVEAKLEHGLPPAPMTAADNGQTSQ